MDALKLENEEILFDHRSLRIQLYNVEKKEIKIVKEKLKFVEARSLKFNNLLTCHLYMGAEDLMILHFEPS